MASNVRNPNGNGSEVTEKVRQTLSRFGFLFINSVSQALPEHAKRDTSNEASPRPEVAEAAPTAPPTPPNGGMKAWLQVLGAFFLFFNSW